MTTLQQIANDLHDGRGATQNESVRPDLTAYDDNQMAALLTVKALMDNEWDLTLKAKAEADKVQVPDGVTWEDEMMGNWVRPVPAEQAAYARAATLMREAVIAARAEARPIICAAPVVRVGAIG